MTSSPPNSPPPEADAPEPVDENRLVRERYDKAARLAETGATLFAQRFGPTRQAAEVRAEQESLLESKEPVTLAGRVMAVRSFGKAGFLVIDDVSGRMQAYVKKDVTDTDGFDLFKKWLDVGDWVGVTGPMFITRHGELTVEAHQLVLLTKSMRPLPEKWHGLKDVETRSRQRYVDLIVNPDARETFRRRSAVVSLLRRMLDERGYMEVETPMMQSVYGGATARPFITHHNTLDMDLYLRIAPELFLKRLVVGGFERVYEINRNFRNEGLDTRHNPEFTMLELYTAGWDYRDTMGLTEEMVRTAAREVCGSARIEFQGDAIDLESPWRRVRIVDAVAEALGLGDDHGLRWGLASLDELRSGLGEAAARADVASALDEDEDADQVLFTLFERLVESTLVQPTLVVDYPASMCPLAKTRADDPATAERFELFVAGMEMANGYSELNDPAEQLRHFEQQVGRRAAGDEEAMGEVDRDYVRALEYGMPPCSGLGVGIDRLVMLLTDRASIRDVILFPLMRPEN